MCSIHMRLWLSKCGSLVCGECYMACVVMSNYLRCAELVEFI